MKIILSPAKQFNKAAKRGTTIPKYINHSKDIINEMKSIDIDELKDILKLTTPKMSDLCEEIMDNIDFKEFEALDLYNGIAFRTVEKEDNDNYLSDNLIICSALYGILKPTDCISEYRLDFTVKSKLNKFSFWRDILKDEFLEEDFVVNIASNEFSKLFNQDNFINIHFLILDDGVYKKNSVEMKKARGLYLNYLKDNKVKDKKSLLDFNYNGYKLKSNDEQNVYFYKLKEQTK